ncbi:MAG: hypothetical protein QF598_00115 [Arenicellales bacterium]|nr:hypothetical protein [Arenicellales bacterium]MDP6853882.1 hypothetical protein [Arenicellales bacterium]MDP6919619.1 hypothetical protein [Arenicellales bacterium]
MNKPVSTSASAAVRAHSGLERKRQRRTRDASDADGAVLALPFTDNEPLTPAERELSLHLGDRPYEPEALWQDLNLT